MLTLNRAGLSPSRSNRGWHSAAGCLSGTAAEGASPSTSNVTQGSSIAVEQRAVNPPVAGSRPAPGVCLTEPKFSRNAGASAVCAECGLSCYQYNRRFRRPTGERPGAPPEIRVHAPAPSAPSGKPTSCPCRRSSAAGSSTGFCTSGRRAAPPPGAATTRARSARTGIPTAEPLAYRSVYP